MQRTGYLTLICLAVVLFMKGQSYPVQLSDLYGEWTLGVYENEAGDDAYIFKRQHATTGQYKGNKITLSLDAFDECYIYYATSFYCGNQSGTSNDNSWAYNHDQQIITIYKSHEWLKNLNEEHPEEFEKLGLSSTEDEVEMELSLHQFENRTIELEILGWE